MASRVKVAEPRRNVADLRTLVRGECRVLMVCFVSWPLLSPFKCQVSPEQPSSSPSVSLGKSRTARLKSRGKSALRAARSAIARMPAVLQRRNSQTGTRERGQRPPDEWVWNSPSRPWCRLPCAPIRIAASFDPARLTSAVRRAHCAPNRPLGARISALVLVPTIRRWPCFAHLASSPQFTFLMSSCQTSPEGLHAFTFCCISHRTRGECLPRIRAFARLQRDHIAPTSFRAALSRNIETRSEQEGLAAAEGRGQAASILLPANPRRSLGVGQPIGYEVSWSSPHLERGSRTRARESAAKEVIASSSRTPSVLLRRVSSLPPSGRSPARFCTPISTRWPARERAAMAQRLGVVARALARLRPIAVRRGLAVASRFRGSHRRKRSGYRRSSSRGAAAQGSVDHSSRRSSVRIPRGRRSRWMGSSNRYCSPTFRLTASSLEPSPSVPTFR